MTVVVLNGDCRAVLPTIEGGVIRCCVTSPPYWALRSYLPKEHELKPFEIGQESTPREYVDTLVGVFHEVRRILAEDGSLWLNLGDCYATGSGSGRVAGGSHFGKVHRLLATGEYPNSQPNRQTLPGLKRGDLIGLPWEVAFALRDDGWYLRSENIWHKPNACPESVKTRPTKAHEHVFLLTKSERYYFGQDAVREPHTARRKTPSKSALHGQRALRPRGNLATLDSQSYHPLGRNVRTVWTIATVAGDLVHPAPMPPELARRCVLAGSGPDDIVLDPFAGNGTVGTVAQAEGRSAVLVDLNPKFAARAQELATA